VMPVFAVFFMLMTLSSIGMPAIPGNGFVGEFTILLGAFLMSQKFWAVLAATGIVLGAAYMLWLYQRTMFGKLENPENQKLKDLNFREVMTLVPLTIVAFWIGLYPAPFFRILDEPVARIVQQVDKTHVYPEGVAAIDPTDPSHVARLMPDRSPAGAPPPSAPRPRRGDGRVRRDGLPPEPVLAQAGAAPVRARLRPAGPVRGASADKRRWAGAVALVGLLVAGALVASYAPSVPFGGPKIRSGAAEEGFADAAGRPAFVMDGFALVFKLIFLAGAVLCILMAMRFLDLEGAQAGEFYAMVVFAVLGMMLMASGNDFASIYIALETMALSVYVLVGFAKADRKSNEAALKYFLLGAFASGILLYGISLVYGATGSFNLDGIAEAIAAGPRGSYLLLQVGAILVLVGMAFKVAAVPFHMWTPDAYEGAPTPITAFMSTAAKAAAFAMLCRVFLKGFYGLAADWTPLLVFLAVASMTLGNVVAILQDNVKRMLAYSSIAHAGYMLLGLIAVGASRGDPLTQRYGMTAIVLYLLVYTFTNMGAFGLVVMLRRREIVGDRVEDFRGLARTHPRRPRPCSSSCSPWRGSPVRRGSSGSGGSSARRSRPTTRGSRWWPS